MHLSLATKISLALIGMLALAVFSSITAIVSAYRFEAFQQTLVADNLASVRAAEELEIALLEQRGYVSTYILDEGNVAWLEQLDRHRNDFDHWLSQAREAARSAEERQTLDRLETLQRAYAKKRDEVVVLYDAGQEDEARRVLHREVASLYQQSYDLCEQFIAANQQFVDAAADDVRQQVRRVTIIATVTLTITVVLGLALLWLFLWGVLFPLRRLAADARLAAGHEPVDTEDTGRDDLRELGHYVQVLMANVAETRSDLEHSRTQLAHAEKLAAVGKLAASVAHEIRNPLTSMKMWLYSLRRTFGENDDARKKLDVVSDEIVRLERIVHNFLEFSRPPQLNLSRHNISHVIDRMLELMKYRLEEQHIEVARHDEPDLPDVMADADQLRQVLVNLVNNAAEAMPQGGKIRITSSQSRLGGRVMLVVGITDTGHGMPPDVQERVFEPFFTTKADGTGLGLCIAAAVMARHGGALKLEVSNSQGTQWILWIPTCS